MRRFLKISIAVVTLLQSATWVRADETYDRCLTGSDGTNAAWSECGGDYLVRLDKELNDTWQTVFPALTPEGKTSLRAEQRAWNAFKELSCLHLANGDYGREGQVLHFPICRADIIEQRIEYLKNLSELVGAK